MEQSISDEGTNQCITQSREVQEALELYKVLWTDHRSNL